MMLLLLACSTPSQTPGAPEPIAAVASLASAGVDAPTAAPAAAAPGTAPEVAPSPDAGSAGAASSAPVAPAAPAPPPGAEYRVSNTTLTVYTKPVKGGRVRGMIAPKEPFVVLGRVGGSGCAGDGWGRAEADGYVCLEKTAVTTDAPVMQPRLVRFDPPTPDEYFDYMATGKYDADPPDIAEELLPHIYGKAWRRWPGTLYSSAAAYARGAAPSGKLQTGAIRKSHFIQEVMTERGPVLVREGGSVAPLSDVFIYPVSRHKGRDLSAEPLAAGLWPAWTITYSEKPGEGAPVRATPDAAAPVEEVLRHHTPLAIRDTPATPDGKWWEIPDRLGPGRPGYVEAGAIRHPTVMARPKEVAADQQWIDVDLAQQILMLYQGDALQYVTLITSGKEGHGTPKGLYRIQKKSMTADMSSSPQSGDVYYVEDVPWTMHFWPRYALHAAYWHWAFGQVASHGCVNLTPRDAKYLFEHLHPLIPPGWSHVFPTPEDLGTTLRIRYGTLTGPDRRVWGAAPTG